MNVDNKFVTAVTLATMGALLAACATPTPDLFIKREVDHAEEVADIYVTPYHAIPFSDIADKLEPKHALTTEAARGMASIATQSLVSQFLSQQIAALTLALPTRTRSETTTQLADGTTTTTGSAVRGSAAIPTAPTVTPLPDTALAPSIGTITSGIDAQTQLVAGTSVFQSAQLLDNQISKAYYPPGYTAHLVTLQINVQPRSVGLPYDAYVDVSFLPSTLALSISSSPPESITASDKPPFIVKPLVITEALESANVAKSVEEIRQLALAVSGNLGRAGLFGGLSSGSDQLRSVTGTDRNSLVSLGSVSEHTIRIRLGAQLQGSSGRSLVPRTHNVSVVLFARHDDTVKLNRASMVTRSTFVHTENGNELETRRNSTELANKVRGSLSKYGYRLTNKCQKAFEMVSGAENAEESVKAHLPLVRALGRQDYRTVLSCIRYEEMEESEYQIEKSIETRRDSRIEYPSLREVRIKRLFADLMLLQSGSRYSTSDIDLKAPRNPLLPPRGQLIFVLDDGESAATMTVRGGRALNVNVLKAELLVSPNCPCQRSRVLMPVSLGVSKTGEEIQLSFPSLIGANLLEGLRTPINDEGSGSLNLKLVMGDSTASKTEHYHQFAWVAQQATKPQSNPVKVAVSSLISDSEGKAVFSIQIGESKPQVLAYIAIEGADVSDTAPSSTLSRNAKGIGVAGVGVGTISVRNLSSTRPVIIKAYDSSDKEIGKAVQLFVERPLAIR
ncbi:MAG: hypothetical protein SF172_04145 [Burkholderiales bacterium]|nr:hypothetical protein [Burkholderiales bacterium]